MLDLQTVNVFVLTSSVGFQHRNAFIWFQRGPQTTIQTDINHKSLADNQTDGHTDGQMDILYCYSGYLNPWTAAACAARNCGPREWTVISDLKPFFSEKIWYNLYIYIYKVYFTVIYKKIIKTNYNLSWFKLISGKHEWSPKSDENKPTDRWTYKLNWNPLGD